ncbi:MAG: hypothetical protein IT324_23095 [Anaerolineae bacterium]|nr:hypothetical protein [Anaerolineae bacterium]
MAEQPELTDTVAEAPSEVPNLNIADADADADLSRPARAAQFRTQRRSQISTAVPALLLIALGVLYLLKPVELTYTLSLGIGIGVLALSLVMRFLLNARRERGLFFIGVIALLWIGLIIVVIYGGFDIGQVWPLAVSAIGLAMIVTFVFERSHDRGLLLPGLILILAGGVMLPFTFGMLSNSLLSSVALYWPALLLLAVLALLPRVIRSRAD